MFKKSILSPGPSSIPHKSLLKLSEHTIHHRSKEFSILYFEILSMIKIIYQTENDVFPICSSGTGALEAAIVNTLSFKDTVLVICNGVFSNRWNEICLSYQLNVIQFNIPYGKDICLNDFENILKKYPQIKAVLFLYTETSTGALLNVKKIAELIRKNIDALILIDAITGILAHPCPVDEWDLDVVISSSQKSYMTNPGISFLSFSKKAWEFHKKSNLPKFYFDLIYEKKSQEKGFSAWTPPIHTFYSLHSNLKWITKLKVDFWISHNKKIAEATRKAIETLHLKLFPENPSNALTVVEIPTVIDATAFFSIMKEKYKIYIPSGHKELNLKNSIFRIGHIGYYDESDIMKLFHALELTLKKLNHSIKLGSSFRIIQKKFYKSEKN